MDWFILFGSSASGRMGPNSDVDVLVLVPGVKDTREESRRHRRSLVGLGIPVDLIVTDTQRFEETKTVIGGIAYPANKSC